jgi:predicted acetylornithine/succinylornithine family transaminase
MEPLSVNTQTLVEQDALQIVHTYAKADLDFVQGQGSWLITQDGTRYLDFVSGIAVNALGHCHPAILQAIEAQAKTFLHLSNLYPNAPQIALALRMLELTGLSTQGGKAFFCNSGTEANEAAIKFARKYFDRTGSPERVEMVTFLGSFHGRTFGSLAATGQDSLKQGFGPMPQGFIHVPWNDVAALKAVVGPHTCAIMLEPIAAEGGIMKASAEFVAAINALKAEFGCLVIADEIQTGLGRCGSLEGCKRYGIQADLSTWAKALGGGLPLGMVLMTKAIAEIMKPGDHGTTFGGNPLACKVGEAVLQEITAAGFLDGVAARSSQLQAGLQALADKYSWLGELRGDGLLLGIVTKKPVADLVVACRAQKLLVHRAGADVLRLLPPLNISAEDVDDALARIDRACASMEK